MRNRLRFLLTGCLLAVLIVPAYLVFQRGVQRVHSMASASPAATTLFAWKTVQPAPLARFEAQGAVVNGKLYVIGGFYNSQIQATKHVDVYDLASNTWQRIADIPEAITHAPVVVDGATIYVLGGYIGDNPGGSTNHVWKLNTTTNTWSAGPNMPADRGGAGAAILGRTIHFYGGASRTAGQYNDTDRADHYVLNLDTGIWASAANLPKPRNHLGGVALNGKVYAIGGQLERFESSGNQTQVDVYDPASNTWSRAADLPVGRGHITSSVFTVNGRIMVVGGTVNGGDNGLASDDVLLYDPATNVWLDLPPIPGIRKTPVASVSENTLVVSTGAGYGATTATWTATFPETWEVAAALPTPLGEVAGGMISNQLYLVGEGSSATLRYNLSTNTWSSTGALAQRPFVGHHHTAEVYDGKLYVFGGLGSGAGKVQIYTPGSNSWTLGADVPFAAGSSSSALIGGQIYVAGGIIGSSTTNRLARYNPATDTWAELAAMPQGRNHAAAATDGSKLYIFGGRGPGSGDGNTVANGFDTVQIYDPATNIWQSSQSSGSPIAPLPQARGGTGRAVYHNSEFYVFGGETLDGAGATGQNVYGRVDIYSPVLNRWRLGTSMPTARHGISPLLIGGRIYVAGGGTQAGYSSSNKLEIYNPGLAPIVYLPTVTSTSSPSATPRPGGGFLEQAGQLVIEAEHAQQVIDRSAKTWVPRSDKAGYSGAGFMLADPKTGQLIDTNYATTSPELQFAAQFATTGTFYVWVRGWADNNVTNSVHSGLDSLPIISANRLTTATYGSWSWFKATSDGPDATLSVATAGAHTLNIWMREDGFRLDRVLLTTNSGYVPTGAGPPESPRSDPAATPTLATTPTATSISPSPAPTAAATPTSPPLPGASTVRINAGGPSQTVDGTSWQGCSGTGTCQGLVSGGFAYTQSPLPSISGVVAPASQAIYQTEWTGGQTNGVPEGGVAFTYAIPVSNGAYRVRLHFVELNKDGPNRRVFDVRLENTTVLSNFDIWATADGMNRALVREFPVTISDGSVSLMFIRRIENAKISAIEIIPSTP